ncbi:hypothetical protein KM043_009323 [Ampulex compressa]|nr:hypothetical protein KM043_009323 [Ampulex compressa]
MECLIGIKFKDFVLVAADMTNAQSIMVMKSDEHKIHKLSDKLVMAVSGESGDTIQFSEYIAKNIQLYKMRNGYELSPKAAAYFTRRNLADYLRTSCVQVPYAAHGYGGFFSMSILDRYHSLDMSEEEAYVLMKKCVREIHKRLIVNLPNFKVQKVSKDGIKDLPPITAQNLAVEEAAKA